jgi:hypothetical protein
MRQGIVRVDGIDAFDMPLPSQGTDHVMGINVLLHSGLISSSDFSFSR